MERYFCSVVLFSFDASNIPTDKSVNFANTILRQRIYIHIIPHRVKDFTVFYRDIHTRWEYVNLLAKNGKRPFFMSIDREKFEKLFGRIWEAPDGNRYIDYCRNGDKPEYLVNIGELVDYFWQFDTISLIIDVQRLIVDFVKETTRPKNIEGFLTPIIYDRINEVGYFADLLEMCVVRDSRLIAAYMEWEKGKKLNDIEP